MIQRELRDPRLSEQDKLSLTITGIKVSPDLALADVYLYWSKIQEKKTTPDDLAKKELMAVLQGSAGFLRSRLAALSGARTTPALRFHYDDTLEQAARIAELLAAEATNRTLD